LAISGDPRKNESNIKKHGIDFRDVPELFEGPCLEGIDGRFDYAEERVIAFGEIQGRVIAVVYTCRDGRRRIVSARKATKAEAKTFSEVTFSEVGFF